MAAEAWRGVVGRSVSKIRQGLARRGDRPRLSRYPGSSADVLQCCVAYNELGGFCVPLSSAHRPAAQHVLRGEVWEKDTLRWMADHAAGGDIVHAGTYFGDFLPALARSGAGLVWAFEPNPENHRCAAITVAINGLGNVRLTHAGLGEAAGSLKMTVRDASGRALGGACSFASAPGVDEARAETVPVVTVDEAVPEDRRVSVLQLDVEGFEQQALAGALRTIRRCRPVLVLENLPPGPWLEEHVLALGYSAAGKVDVNHLFLPDRA